jgi:hypothetical protein
MNYRWALILIGLAVAVSILLVIAEQRVYQPSTPFAGGTGDHVHAFALDPVHPDHLYLGAHFGFFRSNDGGGSWRRLNDAPGLPGTLVATSISISPMDSRTVYVTGYRLDNANPAGLAVTHDDGGHWTTLPTGGREQFPDPRVLFVTAGWASPSEAFAYTFTQGLYHTADGGAHWTQVAPPFADQVTAFTPYLDCSGIATPAITGTACPERVLVGTTQGLQVSNAVTAGPLTFTHPAGITGYVYALALRRGANAQIIASTQTGVYSAQGDATAFATDAVVSAGAPTLTSVAVRVSDGTLFGVTAQNQVETSTDGGHTWRQNGNDALARGLSQLQSGLRQATGNNTPQWAGGQNTFLTILQAPATAEPSQIYAAVSFPVQLFRRGDQATTWRDMNT